MTRARWSGRLGDRPGGMAVVRTRGSRGRPPGWGDVELAARTPHAPPSRCPRGTRAHAAPLAGSGKSLGG